MVPTEIDKRITHRVEGHPIHSDTHPKNATDFIGEAFKHVERSAVAIGSTHFNCIGRFRCHSKERRTERCRSEPCTDIEDAPSSGRRERPHGGELRKRTRALENIPREKKAKTGSERVAGSVRRPQPFLHTVVHSTLVRHLLGKPFPASIVRPQQRRSTALDAIDESFEQMEEATVHGGCSATDRPVIKRGLT